MSDHGQDQGLRHDDDLAGGHGPAFTLNALLTPQASAITGFALAFLSTTSLGGWATPVQALFGQRTFGLDQYYTVVAATGIVTLVFALLGAWLGWRAVTGPDTRAGWHLHLGRAAVLLGALGALFGLLTIVFGLVA